MSGIINSATLRRIGETLEGERWQVPLSRKLGVAGRSVRYWLAGRDIPDGVEAELMALLVEKRRECNVLLKELRPPTDTSGLIVWRVP